MMISLRLDPTLAAQIKALVAYRNSQIRGLPGMAAYPSLTPPGVLRFLITDAFLALPPEAQLSCPPPPEEPAAAPSEPVAAELEPIVTVMEDLEADVPVIRKTLPWLKRTVNGGMSIALVAKKTGVSSKALRDYMAGKGLPEDDLAKVRTLLESLVRVRKLTP